MLQTFEITAPNGKTLEITGDQMPTEAQLHDIFKQAGVETGGPTFKQSDTTPNDLEPNTLGTFASHAGAFINPVTAVKGAAHAVMHPVDTAKEIAAAHLAVFNKAKEEYAKGNTTDAAVHLLNAAIPFFGPSIDKAAESIADGKYAAGLGDAVGMGLSVAAPKVIGNALKGRSVNVPGLTNPNVAEAEAAAFGQSRGVPVDAGMATGNKAVKGVQALADRSIGGSLVAGPAKEAQAAAMSRVGGELADQARGSAVSPEQAGQGIRDALASKQQAHTALADASYEKLRQIEEHTPIPVDTRAAKAALKPVYDQMTRQMPLTQRQASPGLQALENIINGPDTAPLSQVDRDLSAIKAIARDQGGLAKFAAGKLDTAVRSAAAQAGPDVLRTLERGRQATIGKVLTDDLVGALPGGKLEEPLAVFNRATAPKDGGIELLRAVKENTPQALPQIARAKLEELTAMLPDKQFAEWNKLGTETRKILFPQTGQSQALDHFFLLSKKLAENPNPSGTAYVAAIGAQGMAFWTNPVASIVGQAGAAGLSALLHSPAGVKALTRGMSMTLSGKASGAAVAAATADVLTAARSLGVQLVPQAVGATPPTTGTPR